MKCYSMLLITKDMDLVGTKIVFEFCGNPYLSSTNERYERSKSGLEECLSNHRCDLVISDDPPPKKNK